MSDLTASRLFSQPVERGHLETVAARFIAGNRREFSFDRLGEGNINETFLVRRRERVCGVLQRINERVFQDPAAVAENVRRVTERLAAGGGAAFGPVRFPAVIPTLDGASYCRDATGGVWRMLTYVEHGRCRRTVTHVSQAYEGGKILGIFHRLLADYDAAELREAIPGFHDLPAYCRAYLAARATHRRSPSDELNGACRMVERRLDGVSLLQDLEADGSVGRRVIHGDPKCDNIVFDTRTGAGVALIDLDTVGNGLLQYDLGDCLRSFCNATGEQPGDVTAVRFDIDYCHAVLTGYRASGVHLPPAERGLIYHGVRLLTLELAVRFLTDYLEGDRYFKVVDGGENLRRALVQLRLLEDIERQRQSIEAVVEELFTTRRHR